MKTMKLLVVFVTFAMMSMVLMCPTANVSARKYNPHTGLDSKKDAYFNDTYGTGVGIIVHGYKKATTGRTFIVLDTVERKTTRELTQMQVKITFEGPTGRAGVDETAMPQAGHEVNNPTANLNQIPKNGQSFVGSCEIGDPTGKLFVCDDLPACSGSHWHVWYSTTPSDPYATRFVQWQRTANSASAFNDVAVADSSSGLTTKVHVYALYETRYWDIYQWHYDWFQVEIDMSTPSGSAWTAVSHSFTGQT